MGDQLLIAFLQQEITFQYPLLRAHPSTFTYIVDITRPFTDRVDAARDGPRLLALVQEIPHIYYPDKGETVAFLTVNPDNIFVLDIMRFGVKTGILKTILALASNSAINFRDKNILPFDVKTGLNYNPGLSTYLGIPVQEDLDDNRRIPPAVISVSINGASMDMTTDILGGILLFEHCQGAENDLDIYIAGEPFGSSYIIDPENRFVKNFTLHEHDEYDGYWMTVEGVTYYFENLEFLQGFISAGTWDGQPLDFIREYTISTNARVGRAVRPMNMEVEF